MLDRWVESELKKRTFSIEEGWKNQKHLLPIVLQLRLLFEEHIWLFRPIILPEDRYALVGMLLTGDLNEVEMVMAIQEEFGLKLEDSFFHADLTILDLVQAIHINATHHGHY